MPKGLAQYKKCNSRRNELRNQSNSWTNIWAKSQKHITKYFRLDLVTRELTEITFRQFEQFAVREEGFQVAERFAPYATKTRVLTDEMEKGVHFFTEHAEYWIEKELIEPTGQTFAMAKAA